MSRIWFNWFSIVCTVFFLLFVSFPVAHLIVSFLFAFVTCFYRYWLWYRMPNAYRLWLWRTSTMGESNGKKKEISHATRQYNQKINIIINSIFSPVRRFASVFAFSFFFVFYSILSNCIIIFISSFDLRWFHFTSFFFKQKTVYDKWCARILCAYVYVFQFMCELILNEDRTNEKTAKSGKTLFSHILYRNDEATYYVHKQIVKTIE